MRRGQASGGGAASVVRASYATLADEDSASSRTGGEQPLSYTRHLQARQRALGERRPSVLRAPSGSSLSPWFKGDLAPWRTSRR
jgi:hypothetical protein